MDRFDLIVVGCGPAGATAARVAAERGLSVIIIDRRRSVGMPPRCAGYVPSWVRARTGCDDSALVQTVSGIRVGGAGRCMCEVRAPGFILDRTRFDKNLAIHALEAGADLAQAMVLHCDGVRVIGRRDGREAAFGADYILGADGPASVIGRSVGLANRRFWATLQYEVGLKSPDTWIELHPQEDPSGLTWFVPSGQTARIGIGLPRDQARFLKSRLLRFMQRLIADGRIFGGILGCSGGLLPINGSLQFLCSDRVLLAGDAGGIAEPFSGAGIASAVVCGELAGELVAAAHKGDRPALLADYRSELRGRLPTVDAGALSDRIAQVAAWRP